MVAMLFRRRGQDNERNAATRSLRGLVASTAAESVQIRFVFSSQFASEENVVMVRKFSEIMEEISSSLEQLQN